MMMDNIHTISAMQRDITHTFSYIAVQ